MRRLAIAAAAAATVALTTAPPAAAGSITSTYRCGYVFAPGAFMEMRTTIDAPATAVVGRTLQVPVRLETATPATQGGWPPFNGTTWEIHLGGATSAVVKATGFTSPAPWKYEGTLTVTYSTRGQVTHRGGYFNAGGWSCRPYPYMADSTSPVAATTTVS